MELLREETMEMAVQCSLGTVTKGHRVSPRPNLSVSTAGSSPATKTATVLLPSPTATEGRRNSEGVRNTAVSASTDDKLKALRGYRRSKGLCFTCGEKWGHDHVCNPMVQLHVVEELVSMLAAPASPESPSSPSEQVDEEICLLSAAAVTGTEAPKAFRLYGQM